MRSPPRVIFVLALVGWAVGFVLLGRIGSLVPLLAVSVALSAVTLAVDPAARALCRPTPRLVAIGVAAAAVMIGASYALFAVLGDAVHTITAGPNALLAGAPAATGTKAFLIGSIALGEEILFRASILPAPADGAWRRPVARDVWIVLLVSALFGAAHLTSGSVALAGVAFVAGTTWALLRVSCGSIVPGILSHIAWDMVFLVLWPVS